MYYMPSTGLFQSWRSVSAVPPVPPEDYANCKNGIEMDLLEEFRLANNLSGSTVPDEELTEEKEDFFRDQSQRPWRFLTTLGRSAHTFTATTPIASNLP